MPAPAERISTAASDSIGIMLAKRLSVESRHVRGRHEWMERVGTGGSPGFSERPDHMALAPVTDVWWSRSINGIMSRQSGR